jgi:uncharacterized protein (DUF305 family)
MIGVTGPHGLTGHHPTLVDTMPAMEVAGVLAGSAEIKAAQDPEIQQMQAWLTAWGAAMTNSSTASQSDDGMGGMDHGGMSGMGKEGELSSGAAAGMSMPGMMSDAQMQQLTDASGAEFDRLFLEMMIMHHQGAIEMADTELVDGSNP